MRIAVDVGHADGSGASGHGLKEHEVAARAAVVLKNLLESAGVETTVIDFPDKSNARDLSSAIREVNSGDFDAVVSLHCDCADSPSARGAHVICKSVAGCAIAAEIAERLCPVMPGRAKWVVQRHDLAILNQTRPPAVLVEMGFLSNAHDAGALRNNLVGICKAIAFGILAWVNGMKAAQH